jgi:hypothetical protein
VITSTLLTLLVIPTFYEILDQMREWWGQRARRIFGRSSVKPAYEVLPAHVTTKYFVAVEMELHVLDNPSAPSVPLR